MLIPVKVNGKSTVAIILDDLWHPDDVASYRDALMETFKMCFLSEDTMDCVDASSCYYMLMLIEHFNKRKGEDEEIEISINQEQKGGKK